MFCLFHVCLPWMLWPCKTQPCKWACVYVSKASPTRICCHKPYFDCLLPFDSWRVSLLSAIIWSSEGEWGSTVCCRLSYSTRNQKPHADVLLPPAFMLIHHSRVTGGGSHCSWQSRMVDQHLRTIVSECSHLSPSHTEGQICVHFICKWLPDSICMLH